MIPTHLKGSAICQKQHLGVLSLIAIKGSHEGIRIVVSEEQANVEPDALRKALVDKLDAISGFLAGARMNVELVRESLTPSVAEAVTSALAEFPDMTLLGIDCTDNDETGQQPVSDATNADGFNNDHQMEEDSPNGGVDWIDIHSGKIRSGQALHSSRSLLLLGNVNPGARISSLGNIYVIGELSGVAHAGVNGKEDAYIYAERMSPLQLRIAGFMARNRQKEEDIPEYAECAVVDDGAICVYPARRLLTIINDSSDDADDVARLTLAGDGSESQSKTDPDLKESRGEF